MVLPIKRVKLPRLNLPTAWQTVIYRNAGLVSVETIAEILSTDTDTVRREARRLGAEVEPFDPEWRRSGYITLIRDNWYLLPTDQLLTLLGISEERLDFILKEEDFLGTKLGGFKPECERVSYSPLTDGELALTDSIREYTDGLPTSRRAFSFFDGEGGEYEGRDSRSCRIIHGYITPCGDPFATDSAEYLPDTLLSEYAREGINGIWLHGVLSALSPYPFAPELSEGYEARRERLCTLISRAARYGIKIYLYLNEPRFVTDSTAASIPDLLGHRSEHGYSLCMSHPEVREYLREAVADLLRRCPLGGIMTITMSEYQTHCRWRTDTNCPRCRDTGAEMLAALVNNTILEGIERAGSGCELIANIWGWSAFLGWTPDMTRRAIAALDSRISVLAVSEYDLEIKKGGVKNRVIDYSISNPGPGRVSRDSLTYARSLGHRVYAKIQANNSWECSAVPYLPVFDLVHEHIRGLSKIGVQDLMLSWTNGGYPSPVLDMIAAISEGRSLSGWYRDWYGECAAQVHRAVKAFSRGFRHYPFSCDHLYFSPETLGPANMWSTEPDEKESTMVCYTFDDLEKWVERYPVPIFLRESRKMLDGFLRGISILERIEDKTDRVEELLRFATVAYIHLECDLLHTRYALIKRRLPECAEELAALTEAAERSTRALISLAARDSRVGFEPSNHYYYSINTLREKIINLRAIRKELAEK